MDVNKTQQPNQHQNTVTGVKVLSVTLFYWFVIGSMLMALTDWKFSSFDKKGVSKEFKFIELKIYRFFSLPKLFELKFLFNHPSYWLVAWSIGYYVGLPLTRPGFESRPRRNYFSFFSDPKSFNIIEMLVFKGFSHEFI